MRIAVASAFSPFGDRSQAADALARVLRAHDHTVEQIWLPVNSDPERLLQRDLGVSLTDVSGAGELMVTVRAPSHLLRHPNKVVWFEPDPTGPGVPVASAGHAGFADAQRVFTTSAVASKQLRHTTGIDAPILDPQRLSTDPGGVMAALLG